jgi:mannan endo-1,4-beta-mannosidase
MHGSILRAPVPAALAVLVAALLVCAGASAAPAAGATAGARVGAQPAKKQAKTKTAIRKRCPKGRSRSGTTRARSGKARKAPRACRRAAARRPAVRPAPRPAAKPPLTPSPSAPAAAVPAPAAAPIAPAGSSAPTVAAQPADRLAPSMLWGTWTDTHRTGTTQPPWDMSVLDGVEASVGKGASLVHFSTPMAYGDGTTYFSFPGREMSAIRAHGSIPFFSWSTHAMRAYSDSRFDLQSIIDGEQDAQILRWADAARRWGSPFFLRFNWEMNGNWFPWSERYGANGSGQYVRAWRHVHDLFRQAGAVNATWVWCPSADPWRTGQRLADVYPGDAYVDWTCLDVYNYNRPRQSFAEVAQSSYDEIAALAPDKPMVIGETSSTEAGGSKAAWIDELFADLPSRFPLIRALLWFDSSNGGSSAYTDYGLDSSAGATAAFAAGIAGSRWQSNRFAALAATGPLSPPG